MLLTLWLNKLIIILALPTASHQLNKVIIATIIVAIAILLLDIVSMNDV